MIDIKRIMNGKGVAILFTLLLVGAACAYFIIQQLDRVYLAADYWIDKRTYDRAAAQYASIEDAERRHDQILYDDIMHRVLFELGYVQGLIDFQNMNGFYESLERENKRRADAIVRGEAIYGQTEFSAGNYMDYVTSNLNLQLPPLLDGTVLSADEEALRAYYAAHPEKFMLGAFVNLWILEPDAASQSAVETSLTDGQSLEEINGAFELHLSESSKSYGRYMELYQTAMLSEPGQTYGPIETDGLIIFYKLIEKGEERLPTYEEVEQYVREAYLSDALSKYVSDETNKRISKAQGNE